MGNQVNCKDCAPADETMYKKQYGVINFSREPKDLEKHAYYFDTIPNSDVDFQRQKAHWTLVSSLKANFIPPIKVDIIKEEKFFASKQGLRVWLPVEEYTLAEYAEQNLKLNPLIPEIQLLNILSSVTDALLSFEKHGIRHGNISPDTVLFDGKGLWMVSTPNIDHVSLESRMRNGKENLLFLVAPEMIKNPNISIDGQAKADLFSLAVTIIHTIDRFGDSKTVTTISDQDIKSKLSFLEQYYSKVLLDLFTGILVLEAKVRFAPAELRRRLNIMIDVKGCGDVFGNN
jgi:hypothetical protein